MKKHVSCRETCREKRKGYRLILVVALLIQAGLYFSASDADSQQITPTVNYYLAESIDAELVERYGLAREPFEKKMLSKNLRPRNVFEKALSVVEEFNLLHQNALDQNVIDMAQNLNANDTTAKDVHRLLTLVHDFLHQEVAQDPGFTRHAETARVTKTPGDVYQMLRQISWHHQQIAYKLGITTNWGSSEKVYDALVKEILPVMQSVAQNAGLSVEDYDFPPQAVRGLIPRYIYKLLSRVYQNIARYYSRTGDYDAVTLEPMNDCDELSPADVFDLTQIISAELKAKQGKLSLASSTALAYGKWNETQEKIEPGHVFRLMQYLFVLSKDILENAR